MSRTFLGEKAEYRVACNGETLHAVRYNAGPADRPPEGALVALRVAEDAVTVIPSTP